MTKSIWSLTVLFVSFSFVIISSPVIVAADGEYLYFSSTYATDITSIGQTQNFYVNYGVPAEHWPAGMRVFRPDGSLYSGVTLIDQYSYFNWKFYTTDSLGYYIFNIYNSTTGTTVINRTIELWGMNTVRFCPDIAETASNDIRLDYVICETCYWSGNPWILLQYKTWLNGSWEANYHDLVWNTAPDATGNINVTPYILTYNFSRVKLRGMLVDDVVWGAYGTFISSAIIIYNGTGTPEPGPTPTPPFPTPTPTPNTTGIPSEYSDYTYEYDDQGEWDSYGEGVVSGWGTTISNISGISGAPLQELKTGVQSLNSSLSTYSYASSMPFLLIIVPAVIGAFPPEFKALITLSLIFMVILTVMRRK